ncbi:transporter substrate-binding domain-containing protein [Ochrobactrum teleogrylli]
MTQFTRRDIFFLSGATLATAMCPSLVTAQTNNNDSLLKKLQAVKKIRIGVANNPPYSSVNPDGTITGFTSDITSEIMKRLGITEIEAYTAEYGALIPGLLANRWDFVSASITATKERCSRVLFADPILISGSGLFYKKNVSGPKPGSLADILKMDVRFGIKGGGADLKAVVNAGFPQDRFVQFTDDLSLLQALLAGRIDYAMDLYPTIKQLIDQRNIDTLDVVYPIPDNPSHGSSCVFRNTDKDLYDAYQKELKEMKESGQYVSIMKKYGYDIPLDHLNMTAEQMCASAT